MPNAPATVKRFIELLDQNGELRTIDEPVDSRYEIGSITRVEQRRRWRARALLFTNVAGYPGARILTNGCATRRHISLALGLPKNATTRQIVARMTAAAQNPIAPIRPDDRPTNPTSVGAGKPENASARSWIQMDPVNLTGLPVPWWHTIDGGRYLGTWHVNISNHPETGVNNVGVYRMQIIDDRHATVSVSPMSHLHKHIAQAQAMGKDLPMAVAIGVPEALVIAGAAALPYGSDEFGFAGGLLGAPLVLSAGVTIPCDVPADAQYLIEGSIVRDKRVTDGPFFDYAGLPSTNPRAFLFEVSAIRHCADPIFRGAAVGMAGAEDHEIYSYLAACNLVDFHGNRVRAKVQRFLFAHRAFRLLQWSGRVGRFLDGGGVE